MKGLKLQILGIWMMFESMMLGVITSWNPELKIIGAALVVLGLTLFLFGDFVD